MASCIILYVIRQPSIPTCFATTWSAGSQASQVVGRCRCGDQHSRHLSRASSLLLLCASGCSGSSRSQFSILQSAFSCSIDARFSWRTSNAKIGSFRKTRAESLPVRSLPNRRQLGSHLLGREAFHCCMDCLSAPASAARDVGIMTLMAPIC